MNEATDKTTMPRRALLLAAGAAAALPAAVAPAAATPGPDARLGGAA